MGFLKNLSTIAGEVVGGLVGGAVEGVGTALDNKFIQEVGQGVHRATVGSAQIVGGLADGVVTTVHGLATDDEKKIKAGLQESGQVIKTTAVGVGRSVTRTATNARQVVDGVLNNDLEAAGQGAKELAKTVAIGVLAVGIFDVLDVIEAPAIASEMVDGIEVAILDEALEDQINIGDSAEVVDDIETEPEMVEGLEIASSNEALEDQINIGNSTEVDDVGAEPEMHHVQPHKVDSYYRADGTYVEGYWRDGDGNSSVNLSAEQGGGYWRSNPVEG